MKRDPLDLLLASQHAKNVHRQDPRHTKVLSPYSTARVMLGFSTLSLPLITRQQRPQIRQLASLVMQERTKTTLPMRRARDVQISQTSHWERRSLQGPTVYFSAYVCKDTPPSPQKAQTLPPSLVSDVFGVLEAVSSH